MVHTIISRYGCSVDLYSRLQEGCVDVECKEHFKQQALRYRIIRKIVET